MYRVESQRTESATEFVTVMAQAKSRKQDTVALRGRNRLTTATMDSKTLIHTLSFMHEKKVSLKEMVKILINLSL